MSKATRQVYEFFNKESDNRFIQTMCHIAITSHTHQQVKFRVNIRYELNSLTFKAVSYTIDTILSGNYWHVHLRPEK